MKERKKKKKKKKRSEERRRKKKMNEEIERKKEERKRKKGGIGCEKVFFSLSSFAIEWEEPGCIVESGRERDGWALAVKRPSQRKTRRAKRSLMKESNHLAAASFHLFQKYSNLD